jgi:hypothetical protein
MESYCERCQIRGYRHGDRAGFAKVMLAPGSFCTPCLRLLFDYMEAIEPEIVATHYMIMANLNRYTNIEGTMLKADFFREAAQHEAKTRELIGAFLEAAREEGE